MSIIINCKKSLTRQKKMKTIEIMPFIASKKVSDLDKKKQKKYMNIPAIIFQYFKKKMN